MAAIFQATGYRDPLKAMTIKALQERQKMADAAAAKSTQITEPMQSPWQGMAHLADVFGSTLEANRTSRAEADARDRLAQIKAGFGPEGPNQQQIADYGQLDPEGSRFYEEQAYKTRLENQKYQRERADKTADQQTEWSHEADVLADTRKYTEGQSAVRTVTGDEAAAMKLDPSHTYEVDAHGNTTDITTDNYRPATPDELRAAGVPLDANGQSDVPYQMNNKTKKLEPVGTGKGQNINIMNSEVEARRQLALKNGLKEGTPEFNQYVLTGQMSKPSVFSSTDKKMIQDADDMVSASQQTIDLLNSTISGAPGQSLNDRASSGWTAGPEATIARNDPFGLLAASGAVDPERGKATTELNNIISNNAVNSLKTIFGGNPTEGERAVLLDLQASVDKSPQERKAIIQRAIDLANRRLAVHKQRADELRGGEYFQTGGGQAASAPTQLTGQDSDPLGLRKPKP